MRPTGFAALAEIADPVAAELEGGEAGFEHRGEHRHFQQFLDRAVGAVAIDELMEMPMLASVLESGLAAFDLSCDGIGDMG